MVGSFDELDVWISMSNCQCSCINVWFCLMSVVLCLVSSRCYRRNLCKEESEPCVWAQNNPQFTADFDIWVSTSERC